MKKELNITETSNGVCNEKKTTATIGLLDFGRNPGEVLPGMKELEEEMLQRFARAGYSLPQ